MIPVLICHAEADRNTALRLASHLDRCAEAQAALIAPAAGDSSVVDLWDAQDAAAVILLLAPECVPAQSSRAAWQPVLDHIERRADPPVGVVLLRPCPHPPLLKRAPLFCQGLEAPVLRAISAWLLGLQDHPPAPLPYLPARLAGFDSCDVQALFPLCVDEPGVRLLAQPRASALAQSLAFQAAPQFQDLIWIDACRRPLPNVASELAWHLGVTSEDPSGEGWEPLLPVLDAHRLLLILDGLDAPPPALAGFAGRSSILSTVPALRQPLVDPPASPLWPAICACRPSCVPLALAARIAGISGDTAAGEAARLVSLGLMEPIDAGGNRFRLLVETSPEPRAQLAHAAALDQIFLQHASHPQLAATSVAELDTALDFAFAHHWPLAVSIANRAVGFLEHQRRRIEQVDLLKRLARAAENHGDSDAAGRARRQLAWLVDDHGVVHNRWQPGEQGSLFPAT